MNSQKWVGMSHLLIRELNDFLHGGTWNVFNTNVLIWPHHNYHWVLVHFLAVHGKTHLLEKSLRFLEQPYAFTQKILSNLAFCSFSFIKCLADDNCGWADQYEFLALSPNAGKAWVSPIWIRGPVFKSTIQLASQLCCCSLTITKLRSLAKGLKQKLYLILH